MDDDIYMKVFSGTEKCSLFDRHIDGARLIIPLDPTWECTFEVAGPDPTLSGVFDIPNSFRPQSQQIPL